MGEAAECYNRSVSNERLVLIDGHSIIHRAYHGLKEPLTVRKTGEQVTAVYGFSNTLLSVLNELSPTHVAVALDHPSPTFRHERDATYKATRVEMPDELRKQMKRCRDIIDAFGIPIYEQAGYEADDTLGTLAKQAAERGIQTYVITLDSDMTQIAQPGVMLMMYRPYQRDKVMYDVDGVRERYGVWPHQIPDLKGLKGDTSDNIPGVPGIGDKTAVKLIQQFGSIESLFERIDEVEPVKMRALLQTYEQQARHSKEMATIVTDLPIDLDLEVSRFEYYDREKALKLFRELEFVSLAPRLPDTRNIMQMNIRPVSKEDVSYHIIRDEQALSELVGRLSNAKTFAFDTETTDLSAMRARPVGISISLEPGEAFYIPVGHVGSLLDGVQLPMEFVIEKLRPFFEDPAIEKIAHNGKYDVLVLAKEGVWTQNLAFDTMIACFLLGDGGGSHRPGEGALSLKWQASKRLGIEMTPIADLIGTGRNQLTMAQVELEKAADYSCADADMTLRMQPLLEEELAQKNLLRLFREVEMPLVPVLARMELAGVAVDVTALRDMSQMLAEQIATIEEQIYDSAGRHFNIGSPQQLSSVLFDELNLNKTKRTKMGYSTDAQSIEMLRDVHPIIDMILVWRQLTKIKSTYVDALPGLINERTGRVHTDLNQTVAITGRLSSNNPNLQNIPVRTELGGQVRRAFIARHVEPDPYLLSADYSQIELRITAHITEDPALLDAFMNDEDIHRTTASQVFNVAPSGVTSDMRRRAKVFNFGVLYGLSPYGLSVREKISHEEASNFIKTYFAKYPGILQYIEETKKRTREFGYAETLLGRRRYLPEINSTNGTIRSEAERAAINMPVQGTAADIIKIAMNDIDAEIEKRKLRSRMILQVHDELMFECPKDELEEMKDMALKIMPESMKLKVPLKVDLKVGKNWADME